MELLTILIRMIELIQDHLLESPEVERRNQGKISGKGSWYPPDYPVHQLSIARVSV